MTTSESQECLENANFIENNLLKYSWYMSHSLLIFCNYCNLLLIVMLFVWILKEKENLTYQWAHNRSCQYQLLMACSQLLYISLPMMRMGGLRGPEPRTLQSFSKIGTLPAPGVRMWTGGWAEGCERITVIDWCVHTWHTSWEDDDCLSDQNLIMVIITEILR